MPEQNFGEWLPDRGDVALPGLLQTENMIPVADGYDAMQSDRPAAGLAPLDDTTRGADRGRTQSGQDYLVAGTVAKLFLAQGAGFVDESISGGYTLGPKSRWEFELYGDRILATNGIDPVQQYEVGISSLFADLSPNASVATAIATFNEFTILGNIVGQGTNAGAIGNQEGGIHWSAIGNPDSWPTVGTQAAVDAQSDWQALEGDGGAVTNIVAAAEYACILRQRQLWRMDYVGGTNIFNLRKIDDHRGCAITGAAFAAGNYVYYPSEEGWLAFDGARIRYIGLEKVDRYWLGRYDASVAHRVSVAHDPTLRIIWWNFTQGLVMGYNYALDRWTHLGQSYDWLLTLLPFGVSLDNPPQATQDMDVASPVGLGDVNLDSFTASGDEILAAFKDDFQLYTFDAPDTYLAGLIETGDYEPGGRVLLRNVRPVYAGKGDIAAEFSGSFRPNAAEIYRAGKPISSVGTINTRTGGRYLRARFTTGGEIRTFQGFDPKISPLGDR